MALTMNSGGARDLGLSAAGRQPEGASGPPPFSNSRLRSYAGRVEGMLDPKLVLSSSMALTGAGLADPVGGSGYGSDSGLGTGTAPSPRGGLAPALPTHSNLHSSSGGDSPGHGHLHARFAAAPASGGRFSPSAPPPTAPTAAWPAAAGAHPNDLAAALSQIQSLKAEIAGVETVLGYLKGSETTTTTMGRKAHKLPSQEQLRARADALAAAARPAAGGGADHVHLSPLRAGVGNAGPGSLAGYGSSLGGGGGGGAGAPSPARARSAGEAAAAGGGGGANTVFDTLASDTKLGRTWRVPKGPQPVGRGEAVILEAALDEALPPGAITAKYGSGAHVDLTFWSGADVRRDFEMLEMVQREVSRQVGVSCVERGRIIGKLADRHAEIFVAVAAAAKAAAEGQRAAMEHLAAVRARAADQASEIASLRSDLASRGAECEDLRHQLAEATTAHEHYVWDNEQEVEQLQAQANILAEEVEHLHVRLSEAVAEKDAALSRGLERLEGEVAAVTDERDDLSQRIRFLERQLHKLRTEMNATVDTEVKEVQTDPVEWGPVEEEDVPDDVSDTPSLAEIRARYAAQGYGALTPEERVRLGLPPHLDLGGPKEPKPKKRRRALGHFEGLILSERPGRVRGLPWTTNAISAIYYDKLQADAVSDREGNPRPRLADFAVEWHMTRFGLRNLAELNLLDLIASVRQHYRSSVRVRWFGQFTGLVEVGDPVDTTPHVSYYLAVLSSLAAPNSLVSLFPDSGAGEDGGTPPVALKAAAMPEAIKAIFRYLNEPEAAVPFLARAVDPITDPVSQLVPLDPLVALLMAEYQRRWDRNAAHLRSLFRAADYDDDGYIGYDEFVGIVRQLMPESGERLFGKMYGDAMRRLPEGQSLVDADTFLTVARAFGWDRWRIDAAPVAVTASSASAPRGGLPQSPGSFSGSVGGGPSVPDGLVSRAASMLSRAGGAGTSLGGGLAGALSLGSLTGPSGVPSPARSVFRRTESVVGLSDADRALLRVLDGALEGLEPPLEDQVGGLLEKLRAAVAAAQQQAAAAAAAVAALPGLELGPSARELNSAIAADNALLAKLEGQYVHFRTVYGQRTDPAAAWLAFRMLLTSLAAATAGPRARTSNSRSRPGSAKGTVGWGVTPRTTTRLTIPSLPFRAGAGSRALTSGSTRASPGAPGPSASSALLGPWPGSGSGQGPASAGSGSLGGGGLGLGWRGEGSFTGPSAGGGGAGVEGGGRGSSPLRPRSATSRSSDLPGRPVTLAQIIQGTNGNNLLVAGPHGRPSSAASAFPFQDRPQPPQSLVIPAASSPAALHRNPLPATTAGRTTANPAAGGGNQGTGEGAAGSNKRGVMFSLVDPPGSPGSSGAAAAAAAAVPAAADTVPSLGLAAAFDISLAPSTASAPDSEAGPAAREAAAAAAEAVGVTAEEEGEGGNGGGLGGPTEAVAQGDVAEWALEPQGLTEEAVDGDDQGLA